MAITLVAAAQNAACDAIVDLIDVGSPPGKIVITDTAQGAGTVLATILCATTAYGSASAGVATLASTPLSVAASASGTAAGWKVTNAAGTTIFTGVTTLSATGADINLAAATQNAAVNAITALIGASGHIQFATSSAFTTILATLPLNATAFGAASAGVATMNVSPAPTAAAAASGTCTDFRFRTSGNVEIFRGSVSTTGANINFDTAIFASGVPVTLSSFTFTMPTTDANSVGTMIFNTTTIVSGGLVSVASGSYTQP